MVLAWHVFENVDAAVDVVGGVKMSGTGLVWRLREC